MRRHDSHLSIRQKITPEPARAKNEFLPDFFRFFFYFLLVRSFETKKMF